MIFSQQIPVVGKTFTFNKILVSPNFVFVGKNRPFYGQKNVTIVEFVHFD